MNGLDIEALLHLCEWSRKQVHKHHCPKQIGKACAFTISCHIANGNGHGLMMSHTLQLHLGFF